MTRAPVPARPRTVPDLYEPIARATAPAHTLRARRPENCRITLGQFDALAAAIVNWGELPPVERARQRYMTMLVLEGVVP